MLMKRAKNGGLWAVGAVAVYFWAASVHSQASQNAPTLQVTQCTVYSEHDLSRTFDCTVKAREVCGKSPVPHCELPIGLSLSGGRDIDGNQGTWEKVRVRYKCGSAERINGPHHQNDHASMVLSCFGG